MRYLHDFSDERNKSVCIHCGSWLKDVETNRDHIPSKCLLRKPYPRKPYPENLPVITICSDCNRRFSFDEEYLSLFLQCVLRGSSDPEDQYDPRVGRALQRHGNLKARIERSRFETIVDRESRIFWKPEEDRVANVTLKNARGHAYYELGEPVLSDPTHVRVTPLEALTATQRTDFESMWSTGIAGWPEVGSRMMQRVAEEQDLVNGWVVVQDGIYRYRVEQHGMILVRSVLWEYLATEVYWSDY